MTKEQILALAGEPVAHVHRFEKGTALSWYGESSNHAGRKDWIGCLALFTADQILAVAKPLEDEIAELKQQLETVLAAAEKFLDSHEECTDFDGFTAQIVSMDDYHQMQKAIDAAKGGE